MREFQTQIEWDGKIALPDDLIARLCLKKSQAVPLLETNDFAYIMPSALVAILLEAQISTPENVEDEIDDGDDELTEEEINDIIHDYRYGTPKL